MPKPNLILAALMMTLNGAGAAAHTAAIDGKGCHLSTETFYHCHSSAAHLAPIVSTAGKHARPDCTVFRTQSAAQKIFDAAGPGDPFNLDADGNGVACDWLQ